MYRSGCADSTELPQSFQFWSVFLGLPHPLQAGIPIDFHAFEDLFPYLIGNHSDDAEDLCNTGLVQCFPHFQCA
jgi:hypothetical protein